MNWIYNRLITILIMIPLVSLYSFSLDLYIPLLPDIQEYFLTSKVIFQYSNSLFMLFCGVGQIIFGPISDNFGRKKTLLFSLIIFILANLICIFSNNVYVFILGRVFQAIGSCGAYLCCFATIRDIYINENESAEMFSYLNIANSISATIAPSLGTYISTYFPWQSIFVALTIASILTFLYCIIIYIETAPYTKNNKFNITNIIYNYKKVFFHINYQVYTLSAACGIGSFFAYYSISPYIYQQVMSFTQMEYSIIYGSCGLIFLFGSYVCGKLISKFNIYPVLLIGLGFHALGCISLITYYLYFNTVDFIPFHLAIISIIWGASFMVGAGIGGTMAPFASIAGSAFALISCYKFVLANILGNIVMSYYDNTPISLGTTLLSINLLCFFMLIYYKNKLITNFNSDINKMVTKMEQVSDQIL